MIRLYAIVHGLADASSPPAAGVALETRMIEGLHVIVSPDPPPDGPTNDALVRHALVLEGLMARSSAVLPARFGDDFPDEAALEEAIRGRSGELRETLRRVVGCVEIGLRVLGPPRGRSLRAENGRTYMERRLEEMGDGDRLARDLHGPLAELARESIIQRPRPPEILLAAYLLPPGLVPEFQHQLRRLEAASPELDFVCTGPWPPYNFAVLGSEDE